MTISSIGSVSPTQQAWLTRRADKPDAAGQAGKAHHHHQPGGTGQPSLSDGLQSLLLGTQSSQATTATPQSVQQQLQARLNQAFTAYDGTSQNA